MLCVIFFCCILCSCNREDVSSGNDNPSKTKSISHRAVTYNDISGFSDGLAWAEDNDHFGCIDTSGKMLFEFDRIENSGYEDYSCMDFENGYAFIRSYVDSNRGVYLIDKEGQICWSYDKTEAFGYGYAVVKKEHSGFDKKHFEYEIYRPDGTMAFIVQTDGSEEIDYVSYRGDGVFYFKDYGFFFAKTEKWVSDYAKNCEDFHFNHNGIAFSNYRVTGGGFYSDTGYITAFSDGTFNPMSESTYAELSKYLDSAEDEQLNNVLQGDSVVFYNDELKSLVSYNAVKDSLSVLKDESISNRIYTQYKPGSNWVSIPEQPSFNDEGIVLQLAGDDSVIYLAIVDYEMNVTMEPIKKTGYYHALGNGNFIINGHICDKTGTEISSNPLYEAIISDSDDVVIVGGTENSSCANGDSCKNNSATPRKFVGIDNSGTVVFEGIDNSEVTTVTITKKLVSANTDGVPRNTGSSNADSSPKSTVPEQTDGDNESSSTESSSSNSYYSDILAKASQAADKPYWVVFNEGYRDDRIEMSSFDAEYGFKVTWDKGVYCNTQKGNCTQYMYNADTNEFEKIGEYNKLTDYATDIIGSNCEIFVADENRTIKPSN